MKVQHDGIHYIICDRCKHLCQKTEFISVIHKTANTIDTTGRQSTINHVNLCLDCFDAYNITLQSFLKQQNML